MCGIVGIYSTTMSNETKEALLLKMLASIKHRGPDGWGIYISNSMAMGHVRLSIIDLALGHQPMESERYVVSFNGEIYNYIELREELIHLGVTFNTNSDTEIILKSFEYYGFDAVKKFNGQFAFILWDKIEKKYILVRDRYGIRPLYILRHNGNCYISSEIKAFDQIPNFKRTFNIENLMEHGLFWNTLDDRTVFNDIRSLASGTMEISESATNSRIIRYYEIGETESSQKLNFDDSMDEFMGLLQDSVKLRLRSDVPVANYLSGGIDSSVVTQLTKNINSKYFKTFSIAFDDPRFDESKYQKEMIDHLSSYHHQREIDYKSIRDNIVDATYHFERPVFRTAPIPLYLLSNDVRKSDIKVVLTGEASDEILFGYDSFKEVALLKFWSRFPESKYRPLLLKKLYPHLKHYQNDSKYGFMKLYYEKFMHDFTNDLVGLNIRISNNTILKNTFSKDHNVSVDFDTTLDKVHSILPHNFDRWSLLQKNQFLEMKTLLSGYLLSSQGDRMSMANAIEGRYPFLDHRLVEKVFNLEDSYKLNGLCEKYLLKRSFKDKIPLSIINRPKLPYQAPDLISFWVENDFSDETKYFLSENMINRYRIFDSKFVSRFMRKFRNRKPSEAGYRDNMLITFILTTQIINYWIDHPKESSLDERLLKVRIYDF